ncbi:MAG TPA: acetate--CoA ligase [Thermoplasmata archaeon]|nr:acetate--CoA ligase [Thermoplasmata archaeon]
MSPDEAAGDAAPFGGAAVPAGATDATVRALTDRVADARRDPLAFWARVGRESIVWRTPFTRTLDWDPPFARWFPDGTLNVGDSCLDRHLAAGLADRVAYFWEGEPGERRVVTYGALARDVARLASALRERGFGPDDFAAIYLPMIPELPVVMLALARLGVPFTTVFSGFSASALGARINDLGARLLFTADGGYRRGKVVPLRATAAEALAGAPRVETVVTVARTGLDVPGDPKRDVPYAELLRSGSSSFADPALPSNHLLYLLYSSGTTGQPKAIAHGTGGYLTHVTATMRWVLDPQPREVLWCAADVGWVTGHSYIVFGPLSNGVTSVLYEGAFDAPRPDRFWEIVERYRVNILYTSPTALRGLRKLGDAGLESHDLGSLRLLGTVGEAINPSVWQWYFDAVGRRRCPIVDTWWQTETGGILISPAPGIGLVPLKPGSATFPLPGIDADVVGEDGSPAPPGTRGYVVLRAPWPGMFLGLHGDEERYRRTYWTRFPGLYYSGDYALKDADGYFWFLGRADEVLKVAGHRLGTIEIEDALLGDARVAEAAVCGAPDPIKGDVPVAFVVLRGGVTTTPTLADELAAHVAHAIGSIARPQAIYFVDGLPKTRSGKIMRRVVQSVASGAKDIGDLTTLEDGASVDEVRSAFQRLAREASRSE